eukprot:scaffold105802_cov71-Phaeocystis_antarctica.AAC.2
MLPTMTMRDPSMSTAKSVPTRGFERLSSHESCGGIGARVRVGVGVGVGSLGPWAIGSRRVVLRGHGEECEEQRGDEQEVARLVTGPG